MRLSTGLKLLGELLGFLLVSTSGTLIAIGLLLPLARIGMGHSEPGSTSEWLPFFVGSGVSGIIMLIVGICLVRKLKT